MKISDYKGEEAIELLADIMEPMAEILKDEEIRKMADTPGTPYIKIAQKLLKRHSKEVLHILALIDQEDPKKYKPNIFTLPMKLVELISMPEIKTLFTSQSQMNGEEHSGSATESTEAEKN
jgi:hypothetical protein